MIPHTCLIISLFDACFASGSILLISPRWCTLCSWVSSATSSWLSWWIPMNLTGIPSPSLSFGRGRWRFHWRSLDRYLRCRYQLLSSFETGVPWWALKLLTCNVKWCLRSFKYQYYGISYCNRLLIQDYYMVRVHSLKKWKRKSYDAIFLCIAIRTIFWLHFRNQISKL